MEELFVRRYLVLLFLQKCVTVDRNVVKVV